MELLSNPGALYHHTLAHFKPNKQTTLFYPAVDMSQLSVEDEVELQSLLKQLLRSINDRITGAPSTECAEEILLHLEETDKNFHK